MQGNKTSFFSLSSIKGKILPDVWVNETERSQLKTKVVHLSQLPLDTAMLLDPNIYRALPQKRLKRSL
ncbi:Zinc finger protein aebp2 [Characodon lateralis]|uniref:Zinc finger protein aebp2 n=1 Tax=Characodon lateralis TaxID=208331 RepID=A0ABU7EML9_9TELE|nr:Zinc finger protein aebp2 [Characodon lateralis]